MGGRYSSVAAIVLGGLVAGTIDLGAASLIGWASPVFIMQAVASGALGKASFAGGTQTAILGFFLQLAMSLLIAGVYVIASTVLGALKRRWIAGGFAYGVGIFAVMNYVVLPLSAVHRIPHFTALRFGENMLAMLLFGLIVAFFARAGSDAAQSQAAR